MRSEALYRITEFEGPRPGGLEVIRPVYHSSAEHMFGLRDASRYAAALSHARGCYVRVWSDVLGVYGEWWYCGQLTRGDRVPAQAV